MKKIFALVACLSLVASLAVGGSIAYLMSTDSQVNVMTLGKVEIKQHEYERVLDENGNPVKGVEGTDFKADYDINESYKLQKFTQAKPAYPAVYTNEKKTTAWDEFQQLWNGIGAPGSNDLFDDSMKNVIDKFVFVENTGKSDAYYRTLVAIEAPEGLQEGVIHTNFNNNIRFIPVSGENTGIADKGGSYKVGYITINGIRYSLYNVTYKEILTPGEVSRPSLLQLYLDPKATNEDCALFGETWDVLVVTQAVQAAGFEATAEKEAAQVALDSAFGEVSAASHPWMDMDGIPHEEGDQLPDGVTMPILVNDAQSLKDAMLIRDAEIVLSDDIVVDADTPLQWGQYMFVANGREVTIDLNGHDIVMDETVDPKVMYLFTTANKATLNIVGEGNLIAENGSSGICRAMNKNDQINIYGGIFKSNGDVWADDQPILYTNSGNIDVYGGKFYGTGHWISNAEDIQGNRLSIVFHEGVLFENEKFQQGDDTRIQLAEGCSLKAVEIDGKTWYQVVK